MSEHRLAWDASVSTVDGYKIYWGTASGVYNAPGSPRDVGNVLTAGIDIIETRQYFIAVTAYLGALESAFSTEISPTLVLGCVAGRAN